MTMRTRRWSWIAPAICLIAAPAALAQQQEPERTQLPEQRQPERLQADQGQPFHQGHSQSAAEKLFSQLDLREDQKQQVKQIIQKHNQQVMEASQRFQQIHMQVVGFEAAMLAAMDQSLDDQQRRALAARNQRQTGPREQGREIERAFRPDPQTPEAADPSQDRGRRGEAPQPGKQAEPQSPNAADQQRRDQARQPDASRQPGQDQDIAQKPNQGQAGNWSLLIIEVAPVDQRYTGLGLTEEQQRKHQQVQSAYSQRIKSMWRELHGLHHEMVMAESQKLSELEQVLDQEQLQQLHDLQSQQKATGQNQDQDAGAATDAPGLDR